MARYMNFIGVTNVAIPLPETVPAEVYANLPRHNFIDDLVWQKLKSLNLTPSPPVDDAKFMRRVYLDLAGRIPTTEQAVAFLDSEDADKRAKLIDELLASEHFGQQFGRVWRDWICPPELPSDMNSGKQPHQQARDLGKWLGEKFNAGEPWDKITRDVLTVEGAL